MTMKAKEAEQVQLAFSEFCKEHGMKKGLAYFACAADTSALMTYHGMTDNDNMHVAANLLLGVARKNKLAIEQVTQALIEGIKSSENQPVN